LRGTRTAHDTSEDHEPYDDSDGEGSLRHDGLTFRVVVFALSASQMFTPDAGNAVRISHFDP
jgi:hypothetical protein